MVIVSRTEERGDSIRFEADPVPLDFNALRKGDVDFGEASMIYVSLDCDEKTKTDIYMSQLYYAIKRMSESKNITTEYYIKLHKSGHDISIDSLDKEVRLALEFLGGIIDRFELLIPRTAWDDFKQ